MSDKIEVHMNNKNEDDDIDNQSGHSSKTSKDFVQCTNLKLKFV